MEGSGEAKKTKAVKKQSPHEGHGGKTYWPKPPSMKAETNGRAERAPITTKGMNGKPEQTHNRLRQTKGGRGGSSICSAFEGKQCGRMREM